MRTTFKILFCWLLAITGAGAQDGVMVDSNRVVIIPNPSLFWAANAADIVAAIGGMLGGGGGGGTNTPTLNGVNRFTGISNVFTGILSIDTLEVADFATARANLHVAPGVDVQAFDPDLDALAALSGNGLATRTGSGTATNRTVTGTSGRITVTNGNGVSGNPTIDIDTNSLATPINGGVPNGAGAWLDWSRISGMPAVFADGTDDGAGGGGGGGSPSGSNGDIQTKNGTNFSAIATPSGFQFAGALLSRTPSGTPGFLSQIGGGWVVYEECIGDPATTGFGGREYWARSVNGDGVIVQSTQESGLIGQWRVVVTNGTTPARVAMVNGDGTNRRGIPLLGFNFLMYIEHTRLRNLNTQGSEEARLWHGIMDTSALGISTEPANGAYIRVTNNVWQGVTASGSSYTVCSGPSAVADDYPYVGFYVDSSQTNVVFFHGLTPSTIAPFGTNTATIPVATAGTTVIQTFTKVVGNSPMTNTTDFVGLFIQK